MNEKEKYFIDLSKCSEDERKELEKVTEIEIIQDPIWVIMFYDGRCFDFCGKMHNALKKRTELLYPDFIKLFEEPTKLPSELLKEYFKNTPREQVLKDWESTSDYDNVNSPKVSELFEGGEGEKENIYEVDFGGNVMARIKIVDNKIEVTNAMNGYGNSIPLSEITITNSNQ